jgi:hypothetical protein
LPPAPCIWRDRKIHTPISAMNGSHDTSSDTNHGTLSPCGRAVIDALAVEPLDQRRIVRRVGLERPAVGEAAVNLRALDQDVAHPALFDLVQKLRERNVLRRLALVRVLLNSAAATGR